MTPRMARLFDISFTELAVRGRQALGKRVERASGVRPFGAPARRGERVPLTAFRQSVGDRFFAGAAGVGAPALDAQAAEDVLAAAGRVLGKRFDVLGYRDLFFGDPVDWHADPVSGRRAPSVHWSRLDPLDPAMVGDSKVVWELNRHQWLVRLGQAYRLTGDERYTRAFLDTVAEWMRANPRGIGINWASALEVALRLMAWTWALVLVRHSPLMTPVAFRELVDGIRAHATHVEKYLSYYFSPNTHLTGEALGLFYAGVVFPELGRARHWRALGARILVEQSRRQILSDGVYFEQSTCYQRYTIDIYLHFVTLAARAGVAVPAEVGDRVQHMINVLLALRRPDGSMPAIGDVDGGWLLPLAPAPADDVRAVLSTAAAVFGRPDYAWAAGGVAPETAWLLGERATRAVEALTPRPPAWHGSQLLGEGGYAVMRSGWDADAHHVIVDVGPLGCPVSGGHGHADLLSVQCTAFGEPFVVDPGMSGYTGEPAWRDFFRGTSAHSTLTVDGEPQAVVAGAFRWRERPRARVRRWVTGERVDFVDASSEAYRRLRDPVTHRRRVLFVKPRYWLIVDDVHGEAEHRIDVRFQFAPIEVTLDTSWARARGRGGAGLLLRAFATAPLTHDVLEGVRIPPAGWIAPAYGQRRAAPCLVVTATGRLPLRIITVVLPIARADAPAPDVDGVFQGERLEGVWFHDSAEGVAFDDEDFRWLTSRAGGSGRRAAPTLQGAGG